MPQDIQTGNSGNNSLTASLAELAEACRVLEMEGHGDKTLGHMSLRDPEGRGFWMKRNGIGLGEVAGADDFVLVDFGGKKIAGNGACHAEWPIHGEIYRRRPDVEVIGHTHPFVTGVFVTTEEPLQAVTRPGAHFPDGLPRYRVTSNLIITIAMGQELAEALGDAPAVLMQNHGTTFCGATIAECVVTGVLLDRACQAQLRVASSGYSWEAGQARDNAEISMIWDYLRRRVNRQRRDASPVWGNAPEELALAHRLIAHEGHARLIEGSIAVRADDPGCFWTSRAGLGLEEVAAPGDLVCLECDPAVVAADDTARPEAVHFAALFARHPEFGAVVYTTAPDLAAFSATTETLLPTGDEGNHFHGATIKIDADSVRLADEMGEARAVFLPNEGALVVGPSLRVAVLRAIFLEKACKLQLDAATSGYQWGWLPESDQGVPGMTLENQRQIDGFWDYYARKLARMEAGSALPGE
jgi:ribulose-5-phosphate 4-epimerase/fuculose-1-phosphate aldolase